MTTARLMAVLTLALAGIGASGTPASAGTETAQPHSNASQRAGTTRLVSVTPDGRSSSGESVDRPSTSADGRFVTFVSTGDDLVGGPPPGDNSQEIYLRDLRTGQTRLISHNADGVPGNHDSSWARISADGSHIVYSSSATNIADGVLAADSQCYVYDTATDSSALISVEMHGGPLQDGDCLYPDISRDGTWVTFTSDAADIALGDRDNLYDIYLVDVSAGGTALVSAALAHKPGRQNSYLSYISDDGTLVAYSSYVGNLVRHDPDGTAWDVFLYDARDQTTKRLTRTYDGTYGATEVSDISADGSTVTLTSTSQLIQGMPSRDFDDVYAYDVGSGTLSAVTSGADGGSYHSQLSADGRLLTLSSDATNLVEGDTNGATDVFLYDLESEEVTLVTRSADGGSTDGSSWYPSISGDGSRIAFRSAATNIVGADQDPRPSTYVYRVF